MSPLRRVAAQPDGIVERRHRIVGELPCPGLRRTAAVRDDTVADLGRGFDLGAGLRRPRPVLQRIFVVAASCRQAGCDKGEEHKHFIVFHRFFFFYSLSFHGRSPGRTGAFSRPARSGFRNSRNFSHSAPRLPNRCPRRTRRRIPYRPRSYSRRATGPSSRPSSVPSSGSGSRSARCPSWRSSHSRSCRGATPAGRG